MHPPSACEICVFRWSAQNYDTHPFSYAFFPLFTIASLSHAVVVHFLCVRVSAASLLLSRKGVYIGRQCADAVLTPYANEIKMLACVCVSMLRNRESMLARVSVYANRG